MKRFTVLFFFGLFAYGVVWTTKAPLPQARAGAGCVVYNDTVYVIGGRGSSSVQYATNYVYDPITDNWSSKASMTYARAHIGCALVNGKMIRIAGCRREMKGECPENTPQDEGDNREEFS